MLVGKLQTLQGMLVGEPPTLEEDHGWQTPKLERIRYGRANRTLFNGMLTGKHHTLKGYVGWILAKLQRKMGGWQTLKPKRTSIGW